MTNFESMPNKTMPKLSRLLLRVGIRHSIVIRHSSFVISVALAAALCLTTPKTSFAIAGVDTTPAPSAPR